MKIIACLYNQKGQAMVEYAQIMVAVSIAVVIALGAIGTKLNGFFSSVPASFH